MAAIEVIEIMMEVLGDASEGVIADSLADGVITESVASQIVEAETTIEAEATAAYNDAIANGAGDDVASQEAIDTGFDNLNQYSYDLAQEWRIQVEAEPKVQLPDKDPITGRMYDDVSADAEPNQAKIDEDSDLGKKLDCPGGDACVEAKAKVTRNFFDWCKENPGKVVLGGITIVVTALIAGAQLFGALAMALCRWFSCSPCKENSSGNCQPSCQSVKCDCNKFCQSNACHSMETFIKWYRKYFIFIVIGSVLLSGAALFAFKSFALLVILLILNVIMFLLKGQLGNMVTTYICNQTAADCVFRTGKPNC